MWPHQQWPRSPHGDAVATRHHGDGEPRMLQFASAFHTRLSWKAQQRRTLSPPARCKITRRTKRFELQEPFHRQNVCAASVICSALRTSLLFWFSRCEVLMKLHQWLLLLLLCWNGFLESSDKNNSRRKLSSVLLEAWISQYPVRYHTAENRKAHFYFCWELSAAFELLKQSFTACLKRLKSFGFSSG